MENLKENQEKYKNKFKTVYKKNHESFLKSKPRVPFYWFL